MGFDEWNSRHISYSPNKPEAQDALRYLSKGIVKKGDCWKRFLGDFDKLSEMFTRKQLPNQ